MAAIDTSSTIVETISIDAPASAVFAALSDPEQLPAWWGSDESYRVTQMKNDLRPGGSWETTGTGRDGKPFSVGGVYRVVEPPHALEFTWRYDWSTTAEGEKETIVRYDLSERHGVTELRVTHSGFTVSQERDSHAIGWKTVFGWLNAYVTRATSDVALVRHLYDRFNARDIDGVLSALAENVAWANGMDGGHVHGRQAVREYWTRQWAVIDPHVDPVHVVDSRDGSTRVEVHQVVKDLEGKVLLDETIAHRFHIENDNVTRFDIEGASELSSIGH